MRPSIYLDNNATTKLHPQVADELAGCYAKELYNPASQHQAGREARRILEQARLSIATALGARTDAPFADRLIFTSGGTESNNLAIHGLVGQPGHILISSIEHPCVLAAANMLSETGCFVEFLPVAPSGHVELDAVLSRLRSDTKLVSVMFANNETGTIQPIAEIARLCLERSIPLHCDAVQIVGKLAVDFHDLGATSLAFSAHKFHGPTGVGGLLLRHGTELNPLIRGGNQQLGTRPGTEAVCPVIGMAKALSLSESTNWDQVRRLKNQLVAGLVELGALVQGSEPQLPHAVNVAFPQIDRQALVIALDLAGIACSTGSACTSGSSEPSHVLTAMGCPPEIVLSSIRLSLSAFTTEAEVLDGLQRISRVIANLRKVASFASSPI